MMVLENRIAGMWKNRYFPLTLSFLIFFLNSSHAQTSILNSGIHGNFQFDGQLYRPDSLIGSPDVPEDFLNNGYANLIYEKENFAAGIRYENYLNPLLGFDRRFKGTGITYRFFTYKKDNLQVTIGNNYEQFGSGLVLRAYEERSLGLDNAIDGIKVKFQPLPGVYLKGIVGRQRDFFSLGEGIVRAIDGEWNLNESIKAMNDAKTKWTIGGSFVSKYQEDQDPVFILPKNVAAGAARINIINGGFNFYGEYAYKVNDPGMVNNYIYKTGEALLLQGTYTVKGFGLTLGAKRIDNMNFRSDRTATGNQLFVNYLPALTKNHTNMLAAFYPYATQPNGEMALQAEVFFNSKAGTWLGGKFGTDFTINYSRAQAIKKVSTNDDFGYSSPFFEVGDEIFFEDFNFEINKKISKKVRAILSYVYINYNRDVIEGRDGFGHIYYHVPMLEVIYKIKTGKAIRTELQHLFTDQDQRNWAMALVEFTIAPKWSFAIFDMYNYGNKTPEKQIHYFNTNIGYTFNSSRISVAYGRQRAGILCVGGVCRNVPAANGLSLSITSSF